MPIVQFIQKVFEEWNTDKVPRLAASLSYYTVFSLAPLFIVIISVAGLFIGTDVAQKQIVDQVQGLVGPEGAQLIDTVLNNAWRLDSSLLPLIVGIAAIILGATGIVGELKDSLNTNWNITPKPGRGLFGTFFERVLSFGMVLAIGFLLLVSLITSATLASINTYFTGFFEQWVMVGRILDILISLFVITSLFALMYKFLTNAKVAWRDAFVGAFVTAVLFTLGKYVIGLYLGNSNIATPFGAAGSLVIVFVWVYYARQILFLGAEITQVYADTYGMGIKPASDAVKLSDAARVEQGTRAPTDPANVNPQTVPEVLAVQAPMPRKVSYGPRFSLKTFVTAALGVRFWALMTRLFRLGQSKPYRPSRISLSK